MKHTPDDQRRIDRIKVLLEGSPDLFWALFSKESLEKSEMRADGETLNSQFGCYSSGEQVMLRLCLDVWFFPCSGFVKCVDLFRLDDSNRKRFLRAYLNATGGK